MGRQSGGVKGEIYNSALAEKALVALNGVQISVFTLILEVTS